MRRIDFILRHIKKIDSVLDIGSAGEGSCIPENFRPIGETIQKNCLNYIGIDKKYGVNAETVNLRKRFDKIVLGLTLMYCDNPVLVLEACKRHLKKDGLLILDVPNIWYLPKILHRKHLDKNENYYFSMASLCSLLEKNGFAVIEKHYIAGMFYNQFVGVVCRKSG